MDYFDLPDGTRTTSGAKYVEAWRKLAKPLLKALPYYQHFSYDPGISIGNKVQLETRDALALYEALTGEKYEC